MKFINIAEEQMMSATKALQKHRDFFNEYFLFEERKEFEEDIQNIIENTDFNLTRSNIALLTERLQSLADLIEKEEKVIIPDIFFLIGLEHIDAQGLIINGKPYTFFNMTQMNEALTIKPFTLDIPLLHEIFHAIHYFYSPSFYIRSYRSIEHQYLKTMIAEGVAVYFSKEIKKANFEDALWSGLIDNKHYKKWYKNCRTNKHAIWEFMKNTIENNKLDTSLDDILFSIPGMTQEDLVEGRLGYYYGLEIVEKAVNRVGKDKILSLDYDTFKNYAEEYFKE